MKRNMQQETRTCQNCKQNFTIEVEDFDFYKKIDVPPPTFCWECRMQRRFAWRNERTFHKNICAATGKSIITGFAPDSGITVYDRDVWWSDNWDPLSYGKEYDFNKQFFIQFRELLGKVPLPSIFNARTVDCFYTQHTGNFKNGYLVAASWGGENISYAARVHESKDSMDIYMIANSELCYECIGASKSYRTLFSQNIDGCSDSYFLFECKGCSNCFGCTNLRNKSYHIWNEPYSKEQYSDKLKEMKIDTSAGIAEASKKFESLKLKALRKYGNINNSQQVTGDNITNSYNTRVSFDVSNDVRDCKFIQNGLQMKDSYDGYGVGGHADLLYEVFDTGVQGSRLCFGAIVYGGMNVFYSYNCHESSNLFGCVGLRRKEYCIFNKQYAKKEYEELIPKIIEHMNSTPYVDKKERIYRYGEFFPIELSPFAYNETVAQEYCTLTKDKAHELGYVWRDPELKEYKVTKKLDELPGDIKAVGDDILDQIIECAHNGDCNDQCTKAFKIIPQELQFYRKMNLPIPRLCSNCRHYARLKRRNPMELWHRKCQCAGAVSENGAYKNIVLHQHGKGRCQNEFETSYTPERRETVYCEQCYQTEVV